MFELKTFDRPIHSQENFNLKVVTPKEMNFWRKELGSADPKI